MVRTTAVVFVAASLTAAGALAQQPSPEQMKIILAAAAEGARTWAEVCESCHGPPNPNTPARTALLEMGPDHIYASLTTGKMKVMGDTISDSQKRAVAMYLTGKALSETPPAQAAETPPAEPEASEPAAVEPPPEGS